MTRPKFLPPREVFAGELSSRHAAIVSCRLSADLETPVSVLLKLEPEDSPYTFLLESVEGGATLGRYSLIGCRPDLIWRCNHGNVEINDRALADDGGQFEPVTAEPLESLRTIIDMSRIDLAAAGLPPIAAGLFGYLGYDMIREVERLPDALADTIGAPDAVLIRPSLMVVFDNIDHSMLLLAPVWSANVTADEAYDAACARLDDALARLRKPVPEITTPEMVPDRAEPVCNTTREEFRSMIARAKEYILAGDIFQVVLSLRFTLPFAHTAVSLYRALRRLNPSPFLFVMNFDGFSIIGSSPEILVRVRQGEITIRPLAGTRPRGKDREEDAALETELLADPKELAEHLMLLDLGRNDVGRCAMAGTVKVTEKMVVERYSHVMHIVSNVTGMLRHGVDNVSAMMAGFPAGTVSGAPKIRAMEIIEELEHARRGIYAGCIGYFGAGGDMDTCIALRTAVLKDGQLHIQAGAGIVADSDPDLEYEEARNKARALLRASEETTSL